MFGFMTVDLIHTIFLLFRPTFIGVDREKLANLHHEQVFVQARRRHPERRAKGRDRANREFRVRGNVCRSRLRSI
jgi:hypothetical protein